MINDNTLKVVKKNKMVTTSIQVGQQKRKLREDSKPSGAAVQVKKLPSSDEDTHGNSHTPIISPIHSPPAKRVHCQEMPSQGTDWGSQPVRNVQGGPRDGSWESQDGQHPRSMIQKVSAGWNKGSIPMRCPSSGILMMMLGQTIQVALVREESFHGMTPMFSITITMTLM